MRHSSCRFAEPGPRLSKQAGPRLCSAPLRKGHSASKTRVNALMALHCVRGTRRWSSHLAALTLRRIGLHYLRSEGSSDEEPRYRTLQSVRRCETAVTL